MLLTLSASKIRTFQRCNRQYYYQYIERLPSEKGAAAVLGLAVHNTIEKVYTEHVEPVNYFIPYFTNYMIEQSFPVDYQMLMDGVKMVADYDYTSTPNSIEVEFGGESSPLCFPNDDAPLCYMHGFFDQVFDDGFVDLKTNKRKPTQETLDNDIQFIIYAWAFERIYHKSPIRCNWYHLRTQKIMNARVLDKLPIAINAVETLLATQRAGEFDRTVAYHCRWCPYTLPCLGVEPALLREGTINVSLYQGITN